VEKSTLKGTDGRLNAVPVSLPEPTGAVCAIDDPDCEACQ
jgi:ribonucleoside-diphosphate reductase alpha chain